MKLTEEQQLVVDHALGFTNNKIIAVDSVAGSGKTSTIDALIRAYKPANGFYTAFNKAIVTDSQRRFGGLIEAKTMHALAYKFIRPSQNIESLNYSTIKENISYDNKLDVIENIDCFFRSSSTDIEEYVETLREPDFIKELIVKYALAMLDGKIPPTFNYMLKCLHLMLYNEEIQLDFDLFAYDEVQDVVPVTLEIFKLINADCKIMLGDRHQNIYSFMDTVNAFEEIKDNIDTFKLTKSFRCSEDIASTVENYGKTYLENNFKFKGVESLDCSTNTVAYITRTNAELIRRMHELLSAGKRFTLTRSLNDIFSLPMDLLNASLGKRVFNRKYRFLEKEYKNFINLGDKELTYYEHISDVTKDPTIIATIKTLINLNKSRINIYQLKKSVTQVTPDKTNILTTAHAFKGLEADMVFIENDLNSFLDNVKTKIAKIKKFQEYSNIDDIKEYLSKSDIEELNTYYVALSRARTSLRNNRN